MNFFSRLFYYIWDWFTGLFKDAPALLEPAPVAVEKDPLTVTLVQLASKEGDEIPSVYWENATLLAENLTVLAKELGKPVEIIDGFRTLEQNKGNTPNSTHTTALGADIKVKGVGREKLAAKIKELIAAGRMHKGGVGVYPKYVHYDVRGKNVSWQGKRKK